MRRKRRPRVSVWALAEVCGDDGSHTLQPLCERGRLVFKTDRALLQKLFACPNSGGKLVRLSLQRLSTPGAFAQLDAGLGFAAWHQNRVLRSWDIWDESAAKPSAVKAQASCDNKGAVPAKSSDLLDGLRGGFLATLKGLEPSHSNTGQERHRGVVTVLPVPDLHQVENSSSSGSDCDGGALGLDRLVLEDLAVKAADAEEIAKGEVGGSGALSSSRGASASGSAAPSHSSSSLAPQPQPVVPPPAAPAEARPSGRQRRAHAWGVWSVAPVMSHGHHIGWGATCGKHFNDGEVTVCKRQLVLGDMTESECRRRLKAWLLAGVDIPPGPTARFRHFEIMPRMIDPLPSEASLDKSAGMLAARQASAS